MNKPLKIRSYGMISTNAVGSAASWALTIHYFARAFAKLGQDVSLATTNGVRGVPKELLKMFKDCSEPDIELCYATPNNWSYRFQGDLPGTKRAKIRLGIFNYEASILPAAWLEYIKYVDYICPSSEYCRDIFLKAGIPDEKIVVLPLGVDTESLDGPLDDFKLKTKKRFKLLNVSIAHERKNLGALLDAYFDEFSADDDVCLVLKTSLHPKAEFEIDVGKLLNEISFKYLHKNVPEIEVVEVRLNNMATLYKQCDALVSTTVSEGFGLPFLEAMHCGLLVASPRYGGQLDMLEHDVNCLLIDVVEGRATRGMQYWHDHPNSLVGYVVKDSVKKTMRRLYNEYAELMEKFEHNMHSTVKNFSWENAAKIVLDLYDGKKPERVLGELV